MLCKKKKRKKKASVDSVTRFIFNSHISTYIAFFYLFQKSNICQSILKMSQNKSFAIMGLCHPNHCTACTVCTTDGGSVEFAFKANNRNRAD